MIAELQLEHLAVEVSFDNQFWHPATCVRGEFVDIYGLPINREKIMDWRPVETEATEKQS